MTIQVPEWAIDVARSKREMMVLEEAAASAQLSLRTAATTHYELVRLARLKISEMFDDFVREADAVLDADLAETGPVQQPEPRSTWLEWPRDSSEVPDILEPEELQELQPRQEAVSYTADDIQRALDDLEIGPASTGEPEIAAEVPKAIKVPYLKAHAWAKKEGLLKANSTFDIDEVNRRRRAAYLPPFIISKV